MAETLRTVFILLACYLAGSIPTGYWAGKIFFKKDIRKEGSKNTGATNVFRVFGPIAGVGVLLIDVLKGFLPVFFLPVTPGQEKGMLSVAAALACVAGHNWTVFLNFKGGKGVATSLGVFLALAPVSTGIGAGVFALVLLFSGYVSLGSMTAGVVVAVLLWLSPAALEIKALGILASLLIFYTHRANIKRLIAGNENRIWPRK